jgi:hypothetical protein
MKVQLFTKEEAKVLRKLREGRAWDPDVLAILRMLDVAQERLERGLSTTNLLTLTGHALRKAHVSCVFFDVFGTDKVAVCRRSGLMGVGSDLQQAFRSMQVADPRPLAKRSSVEPEESESQNENQNENQNESESED